MPFKTPGKLSGARVRLSLQTLPSLFLHAKKTLTLIQFDKILHGNTESPLTMTLATKSALEVWMLTGHAECLEDFEETPCSGQRQGFLVNHHDCTQAAGTSP